MDMILTTKQYATYYNNITGLPMSPENVANLCRNGKLNAFKEPEGKQWFIKVSSPVISQKDYDELQQKCFGLQATLRNISKLIEVQT
ncbi:MAG: hypothetical protein LUC92_05540 [Clostridiales bacterium]|nr:hypothetical protein [Clostridiales bacterium]